MIGRATMPPLSLRLRSLSLRRPAHRCRVSPEFLVPGRSFRLRVSGAVAPSALARASSPCPT